MAIIKLIRPEILNPDYERQRSLPGKVSGFISRHRSLRVVREVGRYGLLAAALTTLLVARIIVCTSAALVKKISKHPERYSFSDPFEDPRG